MKQIISLAALIIINILVFGQGESIDKLESRYIDWQNKDYVSQNIVGTSVDRAYKEIASKTKAKKVVVVAVIDSGVDIEHEDLKGKIWINEDEIPNNNIDDDNNGYVDDINGWNFLGNSAGENIFYEQLEHTRIFAEKDNKHPDYKNAKRIYEDDLKESSTDYENYLKFKEMYESAKSIIKDETGITVSSAKDLGPITSSNQRVLAAKRFLTNRYSLGLTESGLEELINESKERLDYYLNTDFNPREIIGDNPVDINDRDYGNADVIGERSDHGTSVAGLIAAVRDNDKGINGIATAVKIMALRAVPKGDERDKDIALAIRYAVDNGADIINLSFGKKLSPQKEFVDAAVKYAEENGVLIVSAAGNEGKNTDVVKTYPNDTYLNGTRASNWLEVGASDMSLNLEVAASFSNYGSKGVDLFAPGVNIVSLDVDNTYSMNDGTSSSAPVAAGIAALLLSYYPELKPEELIEILVVSSFTFKKPKKIYKPSLDYGKRKKTKFSDLSNGGIINAYNAFLEAAKRYN